MKILIFSFLCKKIQIWLNTDYVYIFGVKFTNLYKMLLVFLYSCNREKYDENKCVIFVLCNYSQICCQCCRHLDFYVNITNILKYFTYIHFHAKNTILLKTSNIYILFNSIEICKIEILMVFFSQNSEISKVLLIYSFLRKR